ncbi:hypothetical protein AURDEDRAFT_127534 [Auricularia subglabra TFB-10046 SS5]|nr:hypothetical protein AURDEDRAFT_127534 [Auricularia subglabra TFB-10046 SS5]
MVQSRRDLAQALTCGASQVSLASLLVRDIADIEEKYLTTLRDVYHLLVHWSPELASNPQLRQRFLDVLRAFPDPSSIMHNFRHLTPTGTVMGDEAIRRIEGCCTPPTSVFPRAQHLFEMVQFDHKIAALPSPKDPLRGIVGVKRLEIPRTILSRNMVKAWSAPPLKAQQHESATEKSSNPSQNQGWSTGFRRRVVHVSNMWRRVALSDCRLWDSFSCSKFRDERHQDVMFDQLQTMLLRSRSLVFRLRIPRRYCGGTSTDYRDRLLALERMDIRRLALYDGPVDVFEGMNPKKLTLTALITLYFFDPNDPHAGGSIEISEEFSPSCIPNLRELSVYSIALPKDCGRLMALQSLTCTIHDERDYQRLFDCCPNIIRVQFNDIEFTEIFPSISLPRSLKTLILRPERTFDLDPPRLLKNWIGMRIPRLVLQEVIFLNGVLPLFFASHPHPAELRLNAAEHEIALVSLPDSEVMWTITPFPPADYDYLEGLETSSCQRLTSISVAMEQLGRLFVSQLHVPGLEQFEFRLNGVQEWPRLRSDEDFFVRAPRLRRVVFNANGSADDISARMDDIYGVLDVLRTSFRRLLVYDAEFLDSLTLRAPAASLTSLR